MFALHLFYSHPGAFDTIVAASPSIWWDDQAILAEETAWRGRAEKDGTTARRTRLLLIAGEYENDGSTAHDRAELAARLAPLSGAGLRTHPHHLADETTVPI